MLEVRTVALFLLVGWIKITTPSTKTSSQKLYWTPLTCGNRVLRSPVFRVIFHFLFCFVFHIHYRFVTLELLFHAYIKYFMIYKMRIIPFRLFQGSSKIPLMDLLFDIFVVLNCANKVLTIMFGDIWGLIMVP